MKGTSSMLSVFMNLLLVATRSRAAWISSSPARHSWSSRRGAVVVAVTAWPSCQSKQIHDGTFFLQGSSSSSASSSLAAAAARRNGWSFPTTNMQKSQRSRRPGSIIACANMMSTGSDGSMNNSRDGCTFSRGDKILVEVISFGPMGASVEVIGTSHDPNDMIDESEPALAKGLILQNEIHYFRQARGNIDVVRGEVLPAYVERVRESTTGTTSGEKYRLDVCLRSFGGKAKAQEVSDLILQRLQDSRDGRLEIGDKSTLEEIRNVFPGISKTTFKTAVSYLYKLGKVQPQPYSISLLQQQEQ